MADIVSPAKRSRMMAGIKGKNTKPEIVVRQLLHRHGFRFRLHRKDLPGRPDIVLPRYKAVIFVNGCFWHGHENCKLFRMPKSRAEFWDNKIKGNKQRDLEKIEKLKPDWQVLLIWECAIKGTQKLGNACLIDLIKVFLHSGESFDEIRGTQVDA